MWPRLRDGGSNVSGIAGAGDRRQRERHGAVSSRRVNSLKAQLERDRIAGKGHLDGLLRQRLRLPLKEGLTCEGGRISRPSRSACRVAGSALPEPARLLFACIIR